jgi:hypothetical protein
VPPVDGHNTTGQLIPSIHGFNGVMGVSLPGFNESTDTRVMQTTGQLPSEFPYNEDMSGVDRSLLGLGFVPGAVNGGVRSSSSTSYLAQANSRPNLTVLINSTVQKVIETGSIFGIKVFKSVQFTSSPGTSFAPGGELRYNNEYTYSDSPWIVLSVRVPISTGQCD